MEGAVPNGNWHRRSITLTSQFAWRFQVTTYLFQLSGLRLPQSPAHVSIRLSGEKTNAWGHISREILRPWSLRRVAESRTSTTMESREPIAMNLLHDDHVATSILRGCMMAAVYGSHDTGKPCTTRTKGWAYDPYSFRTIDVFGDSTSAE